MIYTILKRLLTAFILSLVLLTVGLVIWYFAKESGTSLQDILFWIGAVPIALLSIRLFGGFIGRGHLSYQLSRTVSGPSSNQRALQDASEIKFMVRSELNWFIAGLLIWLYIFLPIFYSIWPEGGTALPVTILISRRLFDYLRLFILMWSACQNLHSPHRYPDLRPISYWMKDTKIPLSIAFLDDSLQIFSIQEMTPMQTDRLYHSSRPANYALEVNQGWFSRHGIDVGDAVIMKLPIILDIR